MGKRRTHPGGEKLGLTVPHVDAVTTSTLLSALCESRDDAAWATIDARYRPVVLRLARRFGLNTEDAADVAQETLAEFFRDLRAGKYARERGRLRAWLLGIARHRVLDELRRRAQRFHLGDACIAALPDDAELTRLWDLEAERVLLERALGELERGTKVSPRTCAAFRLHVLEEQPPELVARTLGIAVRSVYLAKHRCLGRLREILAQLRAAYELD
jgi:RNA polymerase sigma-70 factor (ECF subfamily)